jgi:hypothetical protein
MTVVTADNPFENGPIGQSIMLHLGHSEWTLGAIASMRRAQGLTRVEA